VGWKGYMYRSGIKCVKTFYYIDTSVLL